jgi:hypothetical protein
VLPGPPSWPASEDHGIIEAVAVREKILVCGAYAIVLVGP